MLNKVMLLGRVVREPEIRYTQGDTPKAIARYTLAVNRRFKREGDPDADFINCIAFGKAGEFAEKYMKKGGLFSIVGRLQVRSWEDDDAIKHWSTDVIVEEHYFAGGKNEQAAPQAAPQAERPKNLDAAVEQFGFTEFVTDGGFDDDLPF